MTFTHDTEVALQAAVALVNSAEEPDTLDSVAALDAFFAEHHYTGRHERTRAELEEVRALRPRLRSLLVAERDDAVELVNAWLREADAVPRLVRHEGFDWHLHAIGDDRPLAERIVVETAMAMIDVIRSGEHSRLGACAADDCAGLVRARPRTRSRSSAPPPCATGVAVAASGARRAGG